MITCKQCGKIFPIKIKIDGKTRNLSGRKFCLDCSPFNQYHNGNKINSAVLLGKKVCPRCETEKDKQFFYLRRNGRDFSPYCKRCTLNETVERLKTFKRLCVEYKGGKCILCGYNKCSAALEFHHRNSSEKEFSISECGTTRFTEEIKIELDKCDLLCSNCHKEIHFYENAPEAQLDEQLPTKQTDGRVQISPGAPI